MATSDEQRIVPVEPTGEQWSVGRRWLQTYIDRISDSTTDAEAQRHLDIGASDIYTQMVLAVSQQAPQERADTDLIQRCREIIEWQDSAVLPDGRLAALAASLEVPSSQRLPVAQAITARQAMEALAANPQQIAPETKMAK